ncbi:MAG TPA: hypothetical protein VN345_04225 [Blastocatellia bacterium]|jgi:hypothetical protein|nr:hypothetical protein [Blastocatellia bacterium]
MMDDESRALKERIGAMSDEELLKIVGSDSGDYRKEALGFAESELARRGVPMQISPGSLYRQGGSAEEESDNVCPACRGQLRPGLLFADRELTIIFTDNNEERFVEVWACTECGQVQLAVDFDTDVDEGMTPRFG